MCVIFKIINIGDDMSNPDATQLSIGYFDGMWTAWSTRLSSWWNNKSEDEQINDVASQVIYKLYSAEASIQHNILDRRKDVELSKNVSSAIGMLNHLTAKQKDKIISIINNQSALAPKIGEIIGSQEGMQKAIRTLLANSPLQQNTQALEIEQKIRAQLPPAMPASSVSGIFNTHLDETEKKHIQQYGLSLKTLQKEYPQFWKEFDKYINVSPTANDTDKLNAILSNPDNKKFLLIELMWIESLTKCEKTATLEKKQHVHNVLEKLKQCSEFPTDDNNKNLLEEMNDLVHRLL